MALSSSTGPRETTLLPQSTLPSMSGPVIGTNNSGSVWGSATGVLVNWQPFDFGLRHARVESAAASRDRANAFVQRSQLEVSSAAADAFLTVLAAGQAQNAAQVAVDNWETLRKSIPSGRLAAAITSTSARSTSRTGLWPALTNSTFPLRSPLPNTNVANWAGSAL